MKAKVSVRMGYGEQRIERHVVLVLDDDTLEDELQEIARNAMEQMVTWDYEVIEGETSDESSKLPTAKNMPVWFNATHSDGQQPIAVSAKLTGSLRRLGGFTQIELELTNGLKLWMKPHYVNVADLPLDRYLTEYTWGEINS